MTEKKIIALSGANGFVGSALKEALLSKGYEVWPLLRDKVSNNGIYYNYRSKEIDKKKLSLCYAVIHLAGKNIMTWWSKSAQEEIYDSRVHSSKFIADTMSELKPGPQILINASGIGIYGNCHEEIVHEKSPLGYGFLADLCRDWELASLPAKKVGIRVINLRMGIVLDKNGGMLKTMMPWFKYGLGASIGNGSQYMSFIALSDLVEAIIFMLEKNNINGPVNVASAHAVSNKTFTKALAKALNKKAILCIPRPLIKLILPEQSSILLWSCRAYPKVLLSNGFSFAKADLEQCLT